MLAIKQAQSSPIFPMDRSNNDFFTCQYCSDQFKREDHLRRHELSHRSPKFKCQHEGCGKSFHRNDVLKRHQLVHRPEPEKRKRSCRKRVAARGSLSRSPPTLSQQIEYSSESSTMSRMPPYTTHMYPAHVPWIQIGPFLAANDSANLMNNLVLPPWPTHNTYSYSLQQIAEPFPSSSMTDCTQMCVDRAFQTTLSRLPFIHPSAMDDPELPHELHAAIAAVGARDLDGNRGFGIEYFNEAEQLLQQANSSTHLRRLQCQVLLIDFAAWSGKDTLRQWAMKEQQVVTMAINHELVKPETLLPQNGWTKWVHAEELKRTVFAFYSISISTAVLLGCQIPQSSRHLGPAFPSSDGLWRARNELEWARLLPLWEQEAEPTITFPNAVHSFLTGNIGLLQSDLLNLSIFSQHAILCAIIEFIESSRRFPLNYSSIEGWVTDDASSFSSRSHFLQVLKLWNDVYNQPFEGNWILGGQAQPRIESIMLFKYVVDQLTNADAPIDNVETRFAADQAADCLLSASKVGFTETIVAGILSPGCDIIATSLAQSMKRWLNRLDSTSPSVILDAADMEIVERIREAVANGVFSVSHPMFKPVMPPLGDLKGLCARIVELWSIMLGNTQWVTDTQSPA